MWQYVFYLAPYFKVHSTSPARSRTYFPIFHKISLACTTLHTRQAFSGWFPDWSQNIQLVICSGHIGTESVNCRLFPKLGKKKKGQWKSRNLLLIRVSNIRIVLEDCSVTSDPGLGAGPPIELVHVYTLPSAPGELLQHLVPPSPRQMTTTTHKHNK